MRAQPLLQALAPLLCAGFLSACGGGQSQASEPEPAHVTATLNTGPVAAVSGQGTSISDPIQACGAMESYQLIAAHECPDGSYPLNRDPRAGQAARRGNVGGHLPNASPQEPHIVDLYAIPCSTGAVEVYVCMYHCPPGRSAYDR